MFYMMCAAVSDLSVPSFGWEVRLRDDVSVKSLALFGRRGVLHTTDFQISLRFKFSPSQFCRILRLAAIAWLFLVSVEDM